MKGLDLRKLKKVSSDDKTTVFKHDNGHSLTVAHAGLSPKLLKELQSLPMHGQKMKDGGQPDPQPNASPDDSAQSAPAAPVPVPADYTQGVSDPGPAAITGNNPNNPTPDQTEQAPDASQGAATAWGAKTAAAPAQPMTAGQVLTQPVSSDDALAHLNQQTAALRADFNNGHITPKTYNDLFEKKDTLGKLGMMFGLIAGGAGAGLSHQPNALLGMMDKEIDRDLEAQKQTKSNQFNALNLAEAHYRDEVNSHLTQQQAALTQSQAALANANLPLVRTNAAKTALELSAEQHFMQKAGLLPENTPNGQKARAAAGFVSNAITQQQAQRNAQLAQQIQTNGQQAQQQGQQQSEGYLLSPEAQNIYQGLQYDPTKTPQQKSDIQQQYAQAIQVEKAMKQIDNLYPQAAGSTTLAGSVANALEGTVGKVPFGIGEVLGQLPGEAIRDLGGQKEKQSEAYRAQLEGYIDSALANTGATPTDKAEMARKYFPNESDDANTKAVKLKGLKDKIINLTHTSALDAAGMTRK